MRYRPFGASGMAISAISLLLRDGALKREGDWRALVFAALEAGINTFEVAGRSPALMAGLAEALAAVDRRLVFVAWRLEGHEAPGLTAEGLTQSLREGLERLGLEHIDLLMVHGPAKALSMEALSRLKDVQETRLARLLGVSGDDPVIDAYMATGAFEALSTTYNLASGWQERNRLKRATERDMAIFGYDAWPALVRDHKPAPLGKRSLFGPKPHPLKGLGGYHFLENTPGWTSEEICLAYALTEPAITTVQVEADSPQRIARLAEVPERDLPTGVAAQIEMARFSPTA